MNSGWIKSYRKAQFHEIWKDQNAWRVFQWLIWNVDYETGKGTFGRKQLAQGTGLKEATIYKVTTRIREKYQAVSTKSNNQFTEFRVLNWARYQQDSPKVTGSVNEKEQVAVAKSNTIKEIRNKNKEYIEREEKIPLSYLTNIPENDLEEFTNKFKCSKSQVIEKGESLVDYVKTHNARYSDHKALLRNALRKDFGKRINAGEFKPEEAAPELSLAEKEKARLKIQEIREGMKDKFTLKPHLTTFQEETRRKELLKQAEMLS